MSSEPYVVRRVGLAQLMPVVIFAAWLGFVRVAGFHFPTLLLVLVGIYIVASLARSVERLRIDAKGVRVWPAARIGWEHIQSVTARDTHSLAIRLEPGAPLPSGIQGMIDGELTLPAHGFELDPARVSQAVRAYSEAGGSFSGRPGNGASSSGMSAGGPSG